MMTIDADAAVEYRHERADKLLAAYGEALFLAQTSHVADDWISAGRAFKQFIDAEVEARAHRPTSLELHGPGVRESGPLTRSGLGRPGAMETDDDQHQEDAHG